MKRNLMSFDGRFELSFASLWVLSLAWFTACSSDGDPNGPMNSAGSPAATAGSSPTAGTGAGVGGSAAAGSPSSAGTQATAGQGNTQGGTGSGGVPATAGNSTGGSSTGGSSTAGSSAGGRAGASSSAGAGGGAGTAGGPAKVACTTPEEEKFSFFMTSQAGLQRLSGKADGFGGDLGGLEGADRICQQLAESSSPCQSGRVWRAFLSTTKVDAIDRIGEGPWYDRRGRLLANNKTDLLPTGNTQETGRPKNAAPEIKNDFPNEDGFPNQFPDGGTMEVDNHQVVTGSGGDGRIYVQSEPAGKATSATGCQDAAGWTREAATCWDWTSSEPKGCPRVGHSWGAFSGWNWISVWNESGCAPGGTTLQVGGTDTSRKIGSGGGYGGFYCFAVKQ